jgi:branched-chain amino acid transport system permease protein
VALLVSALIIGVTLGTIYGLMAFGMVASYRISGVVNLGQAGVAALCAAAYWRLEAVMAVPRLLAVPAALLLGAVLGAALGIVVLRLASWAKGLVMILTLAITLLLLAAADLILPLNNPSGAPVFGSRGFDFALTYVTADQIGSFVTCIAVAVATTYALRRTRFGLFVRVIYDDPDTAATLGIPLTGYVIRVWAVAGCMAGLAGILVSTRTTLATPLLLFVMVWGLSGAVLGGLESFALAFAGGLVLGVAEGMIGSMLAGYLAPGLENLTAVVIMAVGVLYVGRRRRHLAHLQT